MFNQVSYNVLIDRLKAFADGHLLINNFTHGSLAKMVEQLDESSYPLMHVTPSLVSYNIGERSFQMDIVFADLPRMIEDREEYEREVISDMIQIGEDLIAEIRNGGVIFGEDVTLDDGVQFSPFIADYTHTISGISLSITLTFPYNWSACDIPANWTTGGTSTGSTAQSYGLLLKTNGDTNAVQSILDLVDGSNITIEDLGDGRVRINSTGGGGGSSASSSLEFNPNHIAATGNPYTIGDIVYYQGSIYRCIATNDAILPTSSAYWTLIGVGYRARQTPVDWNANSGDYQILNKPSIPAAQINSDWSATSGVEEILNKPAIPDELRDLDDVNIASPQQNDTLLFNASSNEFQNAQLGAVAYSNDYNDLDNLPTLPPTIGDMTKAEYDTDNDGIVDSAEKVEIIVRNSTGSPLLKGQVVYLSGATGNRPNAVLADASSEATSSKTIGLVVADIPNNSDGSIATNGTLHDLDTSSFSEGDTLWLSETAGSYQANTPPAEPAHAVFIGYIARSHPNLGRIVLAIQNGYELNELHGVDIPNPAGNDYVYFDSATGLWKSRQMTASRITDSTDVGRRFVQLPNPSAISYLRINADNTISALTLAQLKNDLGLSRSILTNDVSITAANTNLNDATGLSFPITAGSSYKFRAELYVTASVANIGARFGINANVSVTAIVYRATGAGGTASANFVHNASALDSVSSTNVGSILSPQYVVIEGILIANNTGTAIVRFSKGGANAGTLTIKANSFIDYQIIS